MRKQQQCFEWLIKQRTQKIISKKIRAETAHHNNFHAHDNSVGQGVYRIMLVNRFVRFKKTVLQI